MKRITLFSILIFLTLILLTPINFSVATAVEQQFLGGTPPITMIEDGVTSYDMVSPVIVWNDSYSCDLVPTLTNTPQDYDEPEYIYRLPTYRGFVREIFKQEHNDPDECNPYKIHSNIVFDGEYVYWTDDSGLVRLPQTANVGDTPEHVASVAQSTRNDNKVEIADGGDHIYAITYAGTDVSSLWQIRKSDSSWQLVDHFIGANDAHDVSFDGDYFYWIIGGFLYRGDPVNLSFILISISVTGYHAEGYRISCRNGCSESHYVYIAQGDEVVRYNNLNGSTITGLYQSDTTDYTIYDLVTDNNFIFLLEYKSEGGPLLFEHTYHLVRAEKAGSDWGYLYEEIVWAQDIQLKNLQTNNSYVFWQNLDQLLKLPNDAEAIPYTNLFISDVEVTQGVASTTNFVSLIEGKRTFIRVVAQAEDEAVDWVTVHLQLFDDNGQPQGDVLLPVNGVHKKVESSTAPMVLDTHFLFEVPGPLVDGSNFRFEVTLNPYNEPLELDSQQADNVYTGFIGLTPSPELKIDLFHLSYSLNGVHYNNFPGVPLTEQWIQQAYPLADEGNHLTITPYYLNWGQSFGARVAQIHPDCIYYAPDNKNKCASDYAYNQLYWMRYFLAKDNVFYGLIPDDGGFARGRGGNGVAVGPAGTGTWGWDDDGAYTDWYTAHEVGHAIGLSHPEPGAVECKHSPTNPAYPYADAQIGPGGNQTTGLRRYTVPFGFAYELYSDEDWHDMMSYCPQQWMSDYSFEWLRVLLYLNQSQRRPFTLAPAGTELLGVFGVLYPNSQTATIQILQQFDSGAAMPPLVAGDYAIRLLDGQDNVLVEYAFTPEQDNAEDEATLNFGQIVNWATGTEKIQIVELASNAVWAETAVSPNPPQVSNVTLVSPPDPVTGEVTLQWTAVDADGDPLSFDIFYSADSGSTWQPVVLSLSQQSAVIDTSTLSGGDGIFRVAANDGVHTETASSPIYNIANKPPLPTILAPVDGSVFQWGQTIELNGKAFDFEDGGVEAGDLRWRVNGASVGTGTSVSVNDLLVGENEIQLIAIGSRQETASTTIHITVHDDLTISGPDLAVGPTAVAWHVAVGETAVQTKQLTLANVGGGDLQWQASENADWLALSTDSGVTPDTVTLTADPAGLEDGEQLLTQVIIRGYDSEDNLVETAVVPITLSAGNVWNTPPLGGFNRIYLPAVLRP